MSLWATIEPPQPIVDLNSKDEPPLMALKLSVNYSQAIFTVGLEMPQTFAVSVSLLSFLHFLLTKTSFPGLHTERGPQIWT